MQSPAKALLRRNMKTVLQRMTAENKQNQSTVVMQKLMNLKEYKRSQRISVYLSTENEIDTIHLLQTMFEQNKQIFVPTYSGNEMKMLELSDMVDYQALASTKWNIKQPNFNDVNRENPMMTDPLDLVLLPGVAFTRKGDRLGHGMGFYDKWMHAYFKRHPDTDSHQTFLIGLAFREQIVDENQLPTDANDWPLNCVLYPE